MHSRVFFEAIKICVYSYQIFYYWNKVNFGRNLKPNRFPFSLDSGLVIV